MVSRYRLHVERITREDATISVDAESLEVAKAAAEELARRQDIDFGGEVVAIEIEETQCTPTS